MDRRIFIHQQTHRWEHDERWSETRRPYDAEALWKLVGSVRIDHSLARNGATALWSGINAGTLNCTAISGCSGLPEALDNSQSLLVVRDNHPDLLREVRALNEELLRRNRRVRMEDTDSQDAPVVPVIASIDPRHLDLEDLLEFATKLIEAGAGGIILLRECADPGGTLERIQIVRLAADIAGVDTVVFQLMEERQNVELTARMRLYQCAADFLGPHPEMMAGPDIFRECLEATGTERAAVWTTRGPLPPGYSIVMCPHAPRALPSRSRSDRRYYRRAVNALGKRGEMATDDLAARKIRMKTRGYPEIGVMPATGRRISNG